MNPNDPGYEIDTDDYIKQFRQLQDSYVIVRSQENLEKLTKLLEDINELEDDKILYYFIEQKTLMNNRHKLLIRDMPKETQTIYNENYKPIKSEFDRLVKLNMIFIMNNKEAFIKEINDSIHIEANKLKSARSEANKKYYLKKKEMLSKVPKKVLTEEEKRERQKQYSKKIL